MKIKVTDFAKRHFDPKFGGTKVLDYTVEQFEDYINEYSDRIERNINFLNENSHIDSKFSHIISGGFINVINGYAPFCKLVGIPNFTDARIGSLPITLENYQYIRSGYSARTESELPVFSRWLELPLGKPIADCLMLILYSKEQIEKEAVGQDNAAEIFGFNADWGIVSINGQSHPNEEPMKPETMIRNALGISEGGSGVPLDREKYLASVEFWQHNITVR